MVALLKGQCVKRCWASWFVLAVVLFIHDGAPACNVPVFRYALERWPAEPYELVVFHRGELPDAQQALLQRLRGADGRELPTSVTATAVDGNVPAELQPLWESLRSSALPSLTLLFPKAYGLKETIWTGPLTAGSVAGLLDSPARREIVRRLAKDDGDAAVWVLIACGDLRKDEAALSCLTTVLPKMDRTLEPAKDDAPDGPPQDRPKIKVHFSWLKVDRNDPNEAILVGLLDRLDPNGGKSGEPLALPVFGRGRVLTVLEGDRINAEAVQDICEFLIGDCSCTIKDQNPGFDLFIPVDWDGLLTGRLVVDKELPALVSPASVVPRGSDDRTTGSTASETSSLARNLIYVAAAGVVLLVASTWVLLRRRKAPP